MAKYYTEAELQIINQRRTAIPGQDYIVLTGPTIGSLYRGQLDKTLLFITANFVVRVTAVVDDILAKQKQANANIIGQGVIIDYVSNASINTCDPVTSNGLVADSNVISGRNKVIGLALETVSAGFGTKAIGAGQIQNSLWSWTVGNKIFLNGSSLSVTPPTTGFIQMLGTATASDTIDIKITQSTLL